MLKKISNFNALCAKYSTNCLAPKITSRLEEFREKLRENVSSSILTDSFGRHHTYLRISLTERCNLRCTYCMPANGVELTKKEQLLKTDEVIKLADLFVKEGVTKIRLTGGEPTVRKDLVDVITQLKKLDGLQTIAMTSNGIALTRQLPGLQRAGLDLLNISLDTLKPERFEKFSLRKGWAKVKAAIDLAIQLGYNPVKLNTVIMRDFNDDELVDFVELTKDKPLDVRFIEYMPFSGNEWKTRKMVPFSEMKEIIRRKYPEFQKLPDKPNDTSKAYHVPGYVGQVGFITSMSEHFCSSCNRLRITADGNLKVCLFEGKSEISLRDALRSNISDQDLKNLVQHAVLGKKKQHAGKVKKIAKITAVPGNGLLHCTTQLIASNFVKHNSTKVHNIRFHSTLTHVDENGKAAMVDVGCKDATTRTAKARGYIHVGPVISKLIVENSLKKGDALTIAQIAGIMAAKNTCNLIPLCHPLLINCVNVELVLDQNLHRVEITSEVRCTGKTGVEMEALTAVSIAALTVYDMCKSADSPETMHISGIELISKVGGARGSFQRKEL